ncbi:hypothetical protein NIES4075_03250 [Tolypothrix sp. NIES-4075]|uniref:hypothetical protein n=1 Tax=Tolypothrix sp. NIES-4075 TaxID=2005459 RepID=UPI000B5C4510|nr:hypothetical protein [Tolypothrix sp. NIES-4075]GAX39372.1 hypothetical protein NIES4075_03250 [Tolypothrix sp. NIES-4075]
MLSRLTVRSVVVIILVIGALVLVIADHNFRPTFGDLAKVGVGGYLGQLLPEANKRSGDSVHTPGMNPRYPKIVANL